MSFDIDGTLYDLDHFKVNLALRRFWRLRRWIAMEKVRTRIREEGLFCENMREKIHKEMAQRLRCSPSEIDEMVQVMLEEEWPWLLKKVGPFKGIPGILETLVLRGIPVVAASDYPGEEKLKALGLGGIPWVEVLDATETGRLKPGLEIYRGVLDSLGVSEAPGQVLHVGDSFDLDVRGAAGVGMSTALVGRKGAPKGSDLVPSVRCRHMNRFCAEMISSLQKERKALC